jgi:3-hydroxyisobutyrate dehydrogenase
MAERIAAAGFELGVWARRPETVTALAGVSTVAESPARLAAAVDVTCVCVRADDDVDEVCQGTDGVLTGASPGSVVVIHSTVHPRTVESLALVAAERGVDVLDAPVSGSGPAAATGTLVTMVGGEKRVLDRCRPFLAAHSDRIFHVGDIGTGQLAKLLNNGLFYAQAGLSHAVLAFAERSGLDRDELRAVIANSSGRSFALDASAFVNPGPGAFRGLLSKDVAILADLAGDDDDLAGLLAMAKRMEMPNDDR